MRGEGFNQEIAAESRKEGGESAKTEIKRQERSFLDSLRKGAERHRLALSFLFAGALAESMSGSAAAQEGEKPGVEVYETDDELKNRAFEELQADAESFSAIIDDLRAPFVYYEGFDEVYREQGSESSFKKNGEEPVVTLRWPGAREAEGGLARLEDQRVIVSAATGRFSDGTSVSRAEGGKTSRSASVESFSKAETALYAAKASEDNEIAKAEAFRTVGWGKTENQAVANALREAATYLGTRVKVETRSFMASTGEVTIQDDAQVVGKEQIEARGLYLGHETAAAIIEGFVVTKIEKVIVPTVDGSRSYFVANIEGLGETMDSSAPQ